jgi:hypothetical protein
MVHMQIDTTTDDCYTEITIILRKPHDGVSTTLFLDFLDALSEMEIIYDQATE